MYNFKHFLGVDAKIIHSAAFETAIVKIQNNEEKIAVKKLEKNSTTVTASNIKNDELSFVVRALKRRKITTVTTVN